MLSPNNGQHNNFARATSLNKTYIALFIIYKQNNLLTLKERLEKSVTREICGGLIKDLIWERAPSSVALPEVSFPIKRGFLVTFFIQIKLYLHVIHFVPWSRENITICMVLLTTTCGSCTTTHTDFGVVTSSDVYFTELAVPVCQDTKWSTKLISVSLER